MTTESIRAALDEPLTDGQTFNLGSGRATSVLEYARLLGRRMNSQISPALPSIYQVSDVGHNVSSVRKLEALGWKARKGLTEIFDDYLDELFAQVFRASLYVRDTYALHGSRPGENFVVLKAVLDQVQTLTRCSEGGASRHFLRG